RLQLEGSRLQVLARDGRSLAAPAHVEEVLLAPGNRADLLVEAVNGQSILRAASFDRGSMTGKMGGARVPPIGPVDLLSLDASGASRSNLPPVTATGRPRDLRKSAVAARRRLDFSMGMGSGMGQVGMGFTINGKEFDAGRI